jgi:hypothetical protein
VAPSWTTAILEAPGPPDEPSPWRRIADGGAAIGTNAAQAGKAIGSRTVEAGKTTAGAFTRFGSAIGRAFTGGP